jgi:hypothetical protein
MNIFFFSPEFIVTFSSEKNHWLPKAVALFGLSMALAAPSWARTNIPSSGSTGTTTATTTDGFTSASINTTWPQTPATWRDNGYNGVAYTWGWDSTIFHSGTGSVKLNVSSYPTNSGLNLIYLPSTSFAFVPHNRYNITLWVKAGVNDNTKSIELWLRGKGVASSGLPNPQYAYAIRNVKASTSWQQVTIEGIPPTDVEIVVTSASAGVDFWIDDLTINKITKNEYLPSNTATAIPPIMFGMHMNKMAGWGYTLPIWPKEGQSMIRLHDTGTHWCDIETSAGVYNTTRLDAVISYIQGGYSSYTTPPNTNGQILYTMGNTPAFYTSGTSSTSSFYCTHATENLPPSSTNLTAWDNYVTYIGNHLKGKVKYYEIWNEWDIPGNYNGDVANMVELTRRAYNALKAIDSNIVVLSPPITARNGLINLERFLKAGGGAYVDAISYHGSQTNSPIMFIGQVENIKAVMAANSVSKPIFDTEGSVACDPNLPSSLPDCPTAMSTDAINAFPVTNHLLLWSHGVTNYNYYTWEGISGIQSELVYGLDQVNMPNPPGCASYTCQTTLGALYEKAAKWLIGSKVTDGYTLTGVGGENIYVIKMLDAAGDFRAIIWTDGAGETVQLPMLASGWATLHFQTPLNGTSGSIALGVVPISQIPVLVSKTAP